MKKVVDIVEAILFDKFRLRGMADRDIYNGFHGRFKGVSDQFFQWQMPVSDIGLAAGDALAARLRGWGDGALERLIALSKLLEARAGIDPIAVSAIIDTPAIPPTARTALRAVIGKCAAELEAGTFNRGGALTYMIETLVHTAYAKGFVGPVMENATAQGLSASERDWRLNLLGQELKPVIATFCDQISSGSSLKKVRLPRRRERRVVDLNTEVPLRPR